MRSNFSGSRLVRLLNTWAPMDVDASRPDFAARVGQWVGVPDAITLHATHQAVRPSKWPRPQLARPEHALAVAAEFQRVRTALAQAIKTHDGGSGPEDGSAKAANSPTFAPYRRRLQALQHHMDMRIVALRDQIRQVMTTSSPELAQLATLDAALEQILREQQQKLLATLPVFAERRFEHWRKCRPGGPDDPDTTQPAAPPGSAVAGGRAAFDKELQQLLLAELDDRLEPILGLVEACSNMDKMQ